MPQPKTKAQVLRATEIKLIKMAQAQLGMDDETYRSMLFALCGGKTSSTSLTWQERAAVLAHLKRSGFVVKSNRRASPLDGMAKLQAMWHALAEVGAVEKPATTEARDAAIEAWAKRELKGDLMAMRFVDRTVMRDLIERMKKWCVRVGAPDEHDQWKAEQARLEAES